MVPVLVSLLINIHSLVCLKTCAFIFMQHLSLQQLFCFPVWCSCCLVAVSWGHACFMIWRNLCFHIRKKTKQNIVYQLPRAIIYFSLSSLSFILSLWLTFGNMVAFKYQRCRQKHFVLCICWRPSAVFQPIQTWPSHIGIQPIGSGWFWGLGVRALGPGRWFEKWMVGLVKVWLREQKDVFCKE